MIPKILPKYIENFVKKESKGLTGNILDVGAGNKPYQKYFNNIKYESVDWKEEQTYVCDITKLPIENYKYDTILCNQVLEHVKEPDKVLKEINRVTKINGKIILTLPQSYHIHEEPNNYFTYTKYGIKYLLEKNGFAITKMYTHGKWYTFLADEFRSANRKNIHIGIFLWPLSEILFPITGLLFDYFDKTELQSLGYNIIAYKKYDTT